MTSHEMKKVIVIGGGVAGITAASELAKLEGFDVQLFEADNRIGGRVHSLEFGEYCIENGAQWVHGEAGNSVYELVEPLGIIDSTADSIKFSFNSYFVTQSGEILNKECHLNAVKIISQVLEGPSPGSPIELTENNCVGDWATRLFSDETINIKVHPKKEVCDGVLDWIHRFQNNIDGADNWFQTSCIGQDVYESCPGNPTIPWKLPHCYNTLLQIILNGTSNIPTTLNINLPDWIETGKEVVGILYSESGNGTVSVVCKDGATHTADHVICTVSLGVLKVRHTELFKPNLSDKKQQAIKYLGFGSVDKLHLEFDSRWWPEDIVGYNLVWEDYESTNVYSQSDVDDATLKTKVNGFPMWTRSLLGFYPVKSHPNCLMTWLTGPASRLAEKLSDEEVKLTCLTVLRQFLGKAYEVGECTGFVRSSWASNPYTRGSYSFRTVQSEKEDVWAAHLALPVFSDTKSPILCFAGEATHDHFYSTVHGAHDTGKREAARIADFYKVADQN